MFHVQRVIAEGFHRCVTFGIMDVLTFSAHKLTGASRCGCIEHDPFVRNLERATAGRTGVASKQSQALSPMCSADNSFHATHFQVDCDDRTLEEVNLKP